MTINYQSQQKEQPTKIKLAEDQIAGHADHWHILTDNVAEVVPDWLQKMIETATVSQGLSEAQPTEQLLIAQNLDTHIKQVLALNNGKPEKLINTFPCVNSPYGSTCTIERVIICDETLDAVLRFKAEDGTTIYAYDQLYAVNGSLYSQNVPYFVNFSAWAYNISLSKQDEVVKVEDQQAIRYHRAFNDIVAKNNGEVPTDIQQQIQNWEPETDEPMAPVEINLGNMCAYLFGDTLGQEDEAWCQGQVIGKQTSDFYGVDILLFDVVILREADTKPLVVRMAALNNDQTAAIQVNDYVQANIWLQAAIYEQNQNK